MDFIGYIIVMFFFLLLIFIGEDKMGAEIFYEETKDKLILELNSLDFKL